MKFRKAIVLAIVFSLFFSSVAYALEQGPRLFFFKTNRMSTYGGNLNIELEKRVNENVILDNNILSIGVKDNYVYFGTHTGVSRLDLLTMNFHHYVLELFNIVQSIAVGKSDFDTVWIGRAGGIAKIRGEKVEDVRGSTFDKIFVYNMYVDKDSNVWMATNNDLHKFNSRDQWQTYRFEREQLPTSFITAVFVDSGGNFWLGSDVIYRLEKEKSFRKDNFDIFAPADTVQLRVNDIDEVGGWIYFATDRGVFRRKVTENTWEHFADASSLPNIFVTSLAVGKDGTLWMGTRNGLVSYKEGVFFTYTSANGLVGDFVNTVQTAGDAIWVGTTTGAARLEDNSWIMVTRNGVEDKDFRLTDEQQQLQNEIRRREEAQVEKEERKKQAEIWAARQGIFEDLKDIETWAADYVFELYESGVFQKNDKFFPLRNVTREELAKMVAVAAGLDPDKYATELAPFIDVPEQHWANRYIVALNKAGVLDKGKVFGLGEPMTRLEAVKWILKAFEVRLTQHDSPKFGDVPETDRSWVETADTYKIASGYNKETSSKVVAREIYSLPRFLSPGSSGEDVKSLQKILQATGFYPAGREITGFYDGTTTDAVADYQVARGILSKFTGGQFTTGLGAAGGDTRSRMISEMVPTGKVDSSEWFFDPDGNLTRAQMAKILSQARKVFESLNQ